jgi:hypothetical protein
LSGKNRLSAFRRALSRGSENASRQGRRSKWEGIGVVGFVVALSVLAALLAAPRAAKPDVLPLPIPDRAVLRRVNARTAELAQEAQTSGLSFDVRAVGEAIRNCGAETVEGKGVSEAVLGQVRMTVRRAREKKNERGLLGLLALQTRLFIDATHAFEKSGTASTDLRELGGDFIWMAKQNGWLDGRHIVLDDDERAAIFRMRWTELTALRSEAAFSPTLDEYRAYYALYLRPGGTASREGGERAFSVVRALEKRDPSYPAAFARGVLLYRAGSFDEAADAFRAHLALHPDGPWTLRAKNHVLLALARASDGD